MNRQDPEESKFCLAVLNDWENVAFIKYKKFKTIPWFWTLCTCCVFFTKFFTFYGKTTSFSTVTTIIVSCYGKKVNGTHTLFQHNPNYPPFSYLSHPIPPKNRPLYSQPFVYKLNGPWKIPRGIFTVIVINASLKSFHILQRKNMSYSSS